MDAPEPICRTDSTFSIPPRDQPGVTSYLDFDGAFVPALESFSKDKVDNCVLLDDVQVKDVTISDELKTLAAQASRLSQQCFKECAVLRTSKRQGWKMCMLLSPCQKSLMGFIAYRFKTSQQVLEVGKIAVDEHYRGFGCGRRMIKHVVGLAKRHPEVGYVTLSSLPEAISFYKCLGFTAHDDVKYTQVRLAPGEELADGQMYMEKHVGGVKSGNKPGMKKKK